MCIRDSAEFCAHFLEENCRGGARGTHSVLRLKPRENGAWIAIVPRIRINLACRNANRSGGHAQHFIPRVSADENRAPVNL